jgi:hypothetical protein
LTGFFRILRVGSNPEKSRQPCLGEEYLTLKEKSEVRFAQPSQPMEDK